MISWIVPLIEKDLDHSSNLIESIRRQTRPVDELLIVGSGIERSKRRALELTVRNSGINASILWRPRVHSAGNNRNFGAQFAKQEFVSFIDADDLAHPQRNEILQRKLGEFSEAQRENVILLHSYIDEPRDSLGNFSESLSKFEDIDFGSFEVGKTVPKDRRDEILMRIASKRNPRPIGLRFEEVPEARIHHAPITLSRALFSCIRFRPRPLDRNEDVLFLNQAVARGVELEFLNLPLILYRVGWVNPPEHDEEELLNPFHRFRAFRHIFRRYQKRLKRMLRKARIWGL